MTMTMTLAEQIGERLGDLGETLPADVRERLCTLDWRDRRVASAALRGAGGNVAMAAARLRLQAEAGAEIGAPAGYAARRDRVAWALAPITYTVVEHLLDDDGCQTHVCDWPYQVADLSEAELSLRQAVAAGDYHYDGCPRELRVRLVLVDDEREEVAASAVLTVGQPPVVGLLQIGQ